MCAFPSPDALRALATEHQAEWLNFCRRLIQTPSLPGQEAEVAQLILQEMQRLGYDRAWIDEVGNVIGLMKGQGGPTLLYNGHMDHVDPGPVDKWPHPPYSGDVDGTWLWGRGASDMKPSLALQLYSLALLHRAGYMLPGDCYLTAVVLEEVGGLGTRKIVEQLQADMAVVGEATRNQLARGHRSRMEPVVRFIGRSVHASVPETGVNPHFSAARFLSGLRQLPMAQDPDFGASTVAPTLYWTDQQSANVIPGEVAVYLDWRGVPGESPEMVLEKLRALLEASLEPHCRGSVEMNTLHITTYTGYTEDCLRVAPGFALPPDHPLILKARRVLESALQRPVDVIRWQFCTDGAYLDLAGIPTIGFAPASAEFPHTVEDRIEIQAMIDGLVGYMALALGLGTS